MKYSTLFLSLFMAMFLFACSDGATAETTTAEDPAVVKALEMKEKALDKVKETLEAKTDELENLVDGLDDILEEE